MKNSNDSYNSFSEEAIKGLRLMWEEVVAMTRDVRVALETDDASLARSALLREESINTLQEDLTN